MVGERDDWPIGTAKYKAGKMYLVREGKMRAVILRKLT